MNERIQKQEALSLVHHSLNDERGFEIFRTTLNPQTGSYSMFWKLNGDYVVFLREAERVIRNFAPEGTPVQVRRLSPNSELLEAKLTADLQSIEPDENTRLVSIRARQITLFYIKGERGNGPVIGFRTNVDENVLLGAFARNLSSTQAEPEMVEALLKETTDAMTSPDQH